MEMNKIQQIRDALEAFLTVKKESGATQREAEQKAHQALTALSDLEKEQAWQDIGSAPKPSGQLLLLAEGRVYNGHWYSPYSKWQYDCHFHPKTQPTHFRHLPAPPEGE